MKRIMTNSNNTFGVEVIKKEIHSPLDHSDRPKLDVSELCDATEVKICWQFIRELQWDVSLGIIDVMCDVVTMAIF